MSAYFSAFKTVRKSTKNKKSKVSPTIKSVKPNVKQCKLRQKLKVN